jgi:hypothetical protein
MQMGSERMLRAIDDWYCYKQICNCRAPRKSQYQPRHATEAGIDSDGTDGIIAVSKGFTRSLMQLFDVVGWDVG